MPVNNSPATLLLSYHNKPLPSVFGTKVFGVGVIDACRLNLYEFDFTFPFTSNFSVADASVFPTPIFPVVSCNLSCFPGV